MAWPNPVIHIVDDDPVFTKFLHSHIKSHGYDRVKTFESGESFLNYRGENASVVLLDFSLKGLNGMDVIREIKKRRPKAKIVIITVINDPKLEEDCLRMGAAEYLVKEESRMEALKARVLDLLSETSMDIRRKYVVAGFGVIALIFLLYLMIGLMN